MTLMVSGRGSVDAMTAATKSSGCSNVVSGHRATSVACTMETSSLRRFSWALAVAIRILHCRDWIICMVC